MKVLTATDAQEAQEIVAAAAADRRPFEIRAGASKMALGRSERPTDVLDISRLAGVIDYEPSELVLTVRAATPIAEVEALLDERRQMLSFEPPDWRALLGEPDVKTAAAGRGTLGGVIACNLAGPRRVRAGAPRDYLLGFAAINGRAEAWKAGGKVVKNVTGYDLCKLQAGAFGAFSVLTELTLKVMPKPETACTLVLSGLGDGVAIEVLSAALNTPHEVSAAAHLPVSAAQRCSVLRNVGASGAATAIRVEGPPPSVAVRVDALTALFAAHGAPVHLDPEGTAAFWADVGAVRPLLGPAPCIWRLCPPPAAAAHLVTELKARFADLEVVYDWGGGLIWLALSGEPEGEHDRSGACARVIRRTLGCFGGHATLIAASPDLRASTPVFDPLPEPLKALQARIKAGFDPLGLFNPGRMHEGL